MIKGRTNPADGGMTNITGLVSGDMVCSLTRSDHPIVTGDTTAFRLSMIHGHCCPAGIHMTGLTDICGIDVCR